MSLESTAQLLAAAMDLSMVRLIRGAINPPQPAAGPKPKLVASERICPETRAAPRTSPTAPTAPTVTRLLPQPDRPISVHDSTTHPIEGCRSPAKPAEGLHGPLPAPWQTVMADGLAVVPTAPPPIVKFFPRPVDNSDSGRMLDQFA